MKLLFFGDIVGRMGRRAIEQVLPGLKREFSPDVVIANVENSAHGKGVTTNTLQEMRDSGVDLFTSGNHVFRKTVAEDILSDHDIPLIRPANYPPGTAGRGFLIHTVNGVTFALINLMGRAFFREVLDDPFRALDAILDQITNDHPEVRFSILDWHADASSEKYGMGWHSDGRLSAVLGTHTHVPTADARILPQGTAYISDVGMVGARDSMLGTEIEGPLGFMRTQLPHVFEMPESGIAQVNSVYLDIDDQTGQARSIERVDREIELI